MNRDDGASLSPSYDKTLPISDRLYDFLGAYSVILNGTHLGKTIPELDAIHKREIVDFVTTLIDRHDKEKRIEVLDEVVRLMRNPTSDEQQRLNYTLSIENVIAELKKGRRNDKAQTG